MNVQEAIKNRKSVRAYTSEKVNRLDIMTILEAGRLAPNGFGFEAWNFHVVENKLEQLMAASMNQPQVGASSFSIVITSPSQSYLEDNVHILKDKLAKIGYPEERIEPVMAYLGDNKGAYVREQTFFAASQMVLQAEELGISSNIMGGFDNDAVLTVLDLNKEEEVATLVISFGYEDTNAPSYPKAKKKRLEQISFFH